MRFILILLFSIPTITQAQQTITGQIVDGHNEPVSMATIDIVGQNVSNVSDDWGVFHVTLPVNVKKGELLSIRVSKIGFHNYIRQIAVSPLSISIKLVKLKAPNAKFTKRSASQQSTTLPLDQKPSTGVTSYNQSGGVTANQVYFNIDPKARVTSSLEIRIYVDEITQSTPTNEVEHSVGIASIIALFDESKTRYRLITNYQFDIQQIADNKRRVSLVYAPEDPSQIVGKPISLLNGMRVLAFNFATLPDIFGASDNQKTHLLTCVLYLNGIPIEMFNNLNLSKGRLFQGQVDVSVGQLFSHIEEIYNQRLSTSVIK